jgi:hypothetical protein
MAYGQRSVRGVCRSGVICLRSVSQRERDLLSEIFPLAVMDPSLWMRQYSVDIDTVPLNSLVGRIIECCGQAVKTNGGEGNWSNRIFGPIWGWFTSWHRENVPFRPSARAHLSEVRLDNGILYPPLAFPSLPLPSSQFTCSFKLV